MKPAAKKHKSILKVTEAPKKAAPRNGTVEEESEGEEEEEEEEDEEYAIDPAAVVGANLSKSSSKQLEEEVRLVGLGKDVGGGKTRNLDKTMDASEDTQLVRKKESLTSKASTGGPKLEGEEPTTTQEVRTR